MNSITFEKDRSPQLNFHRYKQQSIDVHINRRLFEEKLFRDGRRRGKNIAEKHAGSEYSH